MDRLPKIEGRVTTLRGEKSDRDPLQKSESNASDSSVKFDLNWEDEADLQATIHVIEPPELPRNLSPAQAAQLSELIEYLHIRIRHLLTSVHAKDDEETRLTFHRAVATSARLAGETCDLFEEYWRSRLTFSQIVT